VPTDRRDRLSRESAERKASGGFDERERKLIEQADQFERDEAPTASRRLRQEAEQRRKYRESGRPIPIEDAPLPKVKMPSTIDGLKTPQTKANGIIGAIVVGVTAILNTAAISAWLSPSPPEVTLMQYEELKAEVEAMKSAHNGRAQCVDDRLGALGGAERAGLEGHLIIPRFDEVSDDDWVSVKLSSAGEKQAWSFNGEIRKCPAQLR